MTVAYYIRADISEGDEEQELLLDVSGQALAAVDEALLEELAEQANVTPLMSFFSMPEDEWDDYRDEVEDLLDEGEVFEPGELTWFPAEEGLKTIVALIDAIERDPDLLDDPEAVIEDLQAMARVLTNLADRQIRWHLAIDI